MQLLTTLLGVLRKAFLLLFQGTSVTAFLLAFQRTYVTAAATFDDGFLIHSSSLPTVNITTALTSWPLPYILYNSDGHDHL